MWYFLRLNQRFWPVLVVILLAVITAGSLWPTQPMPGYLPSDKARHALAYAAIALPIALARPRRWTGMLLGLLGWSIGIELIQPFVGRSRDLADFLANASGVGLGFVVAEALRRAARRLSPRAPCAE